MGFGVNWLAVVLVAVAIAAVGLLAFRGRLSRFGRLPGDIRYSGRRTRVYLPLATTLLLSIFLSLLLTLLGWLFG
jgi:hypothetical protein